jgi:hypothetical protein
VANVGVVNRGTIQADVSGGTITINAEPFSNAGVAQAINGGTLTLENLWSSSGQLNVGTSSVLNLDGSFTGASLSGVNRTNGTINLPGMVNNSSNTLVLAGAWVLNGGTISGGTVITTNGGTLIVGPGGGTLNGATVDGTLQLGVNNSGAVLLVTNGMVLNGTAYLGSPTNGNYGGMDFAGSQMLSGTGTIVLANQQDTGIFGVAQGVLFLSEGGTALTLGPGITVEGNGYLGSATWAGGAQNTSIINYGTISANVTGGTITINEQPFVNRGTVSATFGTAALAGNLNLAGGMFEFGLSNTNRFGHIQVTGNAALGGIVTAILIGGFVPAPLNSFSVLTYGSYTGSFANTELPSSIVWQTNYGPTAFTLTVLGVRPVLKPIVNASSQFLFQFAGSTNSLYTVLASTNLGFPYSNWTTLGTPSLLSNAIYQFIDLQSTNLPHRFYLLRSP